MPGTILSPLHILTHLILRITVREKLHTTGLISQMRTTMNLVD